MSEVFSARTWATSISNLCNICFGGSLSRPPWIVRSLTSTFTGVSTYVKASYGLNGVWYWHICNIFSNTGAAIEGSDVNVLLRFVWVEIYHPSKHQRLFSSLLFPFLLVFYFIFTFFWLVILWTYFLPNQHLVVLNFHYIIFL